MRPRRWILSAALTLLPLLATTASAEQLSTGPLVTITDVRAPWAADEARAREVLEANLATLERCMHQTAIPQFIGSIRYRVEIASNGRVRSSSVLESTFSAGRDLPCVGAYFASLLFQPSSSNEPRVIELTLNIGSNALGALVGSPVGDRSGYGGLGVRGAGPQRGVAGASAAPAVTPGATTVKGSLSREQIRASIRAHLNQFRYCYEQQLATTPNLTGQVAVWFVIAPTGAVSSASLASSTMGNEQVESCVVRTMQRVQFPQPAGGGVVMVTYPFRFQAQEPQPTPQPSGAPRR
jgi:TonB family protein